MGTVGSLNYTPLVSWLKGKGRNTYTQFGEDGLIEGCLQRIGESSRHCFEIGAADGRFFSNTLRLRQLGWFAVLIESNAAQFIKLQDEFGDLSDCILCECRDLDETLSHTAISKRPDLGVIDIDGQDWHLWNNLVTYRPRVMLVEVATGAASQPIPTIGGTGQAGLSEIMDLGEAKDYELVATTYCNALFVDKSEL